MPSSSVLRSAADMHTAYEYIARSRGKPTSECITWIDPAECIVPSPTPKHMGFQVDIDDSDNSENKQVAKQNARNDSNKEIDPMILRLPIYPVSAVHLPSSAFHTLHNTQFKNIKMAKDLASHKWTVSLNDQSPLTFQGENREENTEETSKDGVPTSPETRHQCFVLTLCAQDTNRIASIGTLMEVTKMKETFANDKSLIRIVVECRAIDTVEIQGVEIEGVGSPINDYLIGKVRRLGENHNCISSYPELDLHLNKIVKDYATVRSMYIHSDGVASRELPPYARDAVQSNLPTFTKEDFIEQFWNVAECWQMLCNTVREARRSELQTEMNEIMIDAASKKKGPLQLPIKRENLPEDVQVLLGRMEQKQSEDFLSCGMDACLDFQVLLGMGLRHGGDRREILSERVRFLGNLIRREKDRLDTKERLKVMFDVAKNSTCIGDDSNDDRSFDDHFK